MRRAAPVGTGCPAIGSPGGRAAPAALAALLALVLPLALVAAPPAGATVILETTITTTPAASMSGTEGVVQVTFRNTGTDPASINRVLLEEDDPGIHFGAEAWRPGGLATGQAATVQVPFEVLPNATAGYHPFTVEVQYCGAGACSITDFSGVVTVRAVDALVLESVEPDRLEPGQATDMTFRLRNGGGAPLQNVVVTWSAQQGAFLPLGEGNTFVVEELGADETEPVTVRVVAPSDLAAGLYPVTLLARYNDDSGGTLNSTLVAGVQVGGPAELGVSLQGWDGDSLSLSVSNVGVSPARAVEVRIASGPVRGEPAPVLLGTLDPGDFTTAEVTAERDAGAQDPLRVEVAYTDTDGERRSSQSTVPVGNQGIPEEEDSGVGPWLLAGLVLVLAAAGFWWWRRRAHGRRVG